MFVPGKLFQNKLMFMGKTEAYPSEALLRYSTLGLALGLAHKIRLGYNVR